MMIRDDDPKMRWAWVFLGFVVLLSSLYATVKVLTEQVSEMKTAAPAGTATNIKNWFAAEAAKQHMAETVVFTRSYKMQIDGKSVSVLGNQSCPRPDAARVWFFGGIPQGGDDCIVVEKGTKSVVALFVLDGKMYSEEWAVERDASDRISLRRPNGDYIAQAN